MTDTTPPLAGDITTGHLALPPNGGRGDWMQTFTGRAFFPNAPLADDVDILDVAHALSNICRYAGHVDRFYSVAEHAVKMSEYLEPLFGPTVAMQALHHDDSEAYLVDVPRPVKLMLPDYQAMEAKVEAVIAEHFGLADVFNPAVKDADTRILYDERIALLKPPPIPWRTDREPLGVKIEGWTPARAENRFLNRHDDLVHAIDLLAKSESEIEEPTA